MLVWLASYPRSGNSLALVTLHEAFGAMLAADMPGDEYVGWLGGALLARDLKEARRADAPVFVKTHQRPGPPADPAIYVVRDGRDSTVSYAHYLKECRAEYDDWPVNRITRMLIRGYRARRRPRTWAESVTLWTARPNTAMVRYEDLVQDPIDVLRGALDLLGVPSPEPQGRVPTFDELRRRDPIMYRRGRTGSWREELHPDLEAMFWKLQGEVMLAIGYARTHPEAPLVEPTTSGPGAARACGA